MVDDEEARQRRLREGAAVMAALAGRPVKAGEAISTEDLAARPSVGIVRHDKNKPRSKDG
ncbi:hypothetical protein [Sphingomonas phage Kimi]|nr:hypothetical protein [Sphingomonas phage Kimi]